MRVLFAKVIGDDGIKRWLETVVGARLRPVRFRQIKLMIQTIATIFVDK